jgi:hypothetical protein
MSSLGNRAQPSFGPAPSSIPVTELYLVIFCNLEAVGASNWVDVLRSDLIFSLLPGDRHKRSSCKGLFRTGSTQCSGTDCLIRRIHAF